MSTNWTSPKLVPARITRENEEPSSLLDYFSVLKPAKAPIREPSGDDEVWNIKEPKERKPSSASESPIVNSPVTLIEKLNNLITSESLNIQDLRKLCWNGIPTNKLRAAIWPILIGMVQPNDPEKRAAFIIKRKNEYIEQRILTLNETRDANTWHQITIDMPRTHPGIPLYQKESTQQAMLRILYVWSVRHPTTSYVQGILH
eukprot:NODE_325_length_9674_cov_0.932846.p8 type:complete len:202 gc:universal NODE_325_length_9674_cov_0.932846:4421-5026(+)